MRCTCYFRAVCRLWLSRLVDLLNRMLTARRAVIPDKAAAGNGKGNPLVRYDIQLYAVFLSRF
jgi:hypothetical protein